ncbi:MAG: ribonuclease P protein component [Bacteroides sp.]|nr:MAG: ribonuclease P protein component [Bacteroides sp.]
MVKFLKKERIKKYSDFRYLRNNGHFLYKKNIKIVFAIDKRKIINYGFNIKIAISISKKNFKKAVDRNKFKRIIRSIYNEEKKNFLFTKNEVYIMFIICKNFNFINYNDIKCTLIILFQKLNVYIKQYYLL